MPPRALARGDRDFSRRFSTVATRARGKITDYLGPALPRLEYDVATLKNFEMTDGVIDADMAGSGARGFYNIFFRTQDKGDGESVYLRPHMSGLDDAQQYSPMFQGTVHGRSITAPVSPPPSTSPETPGSTFDW